MPRSELEKDVAEVLIDADTVQAKVAELGALVSADYADREITLVSVLKGSLPFMADLMRAITVPVRIDLMEVSSYGGETETSGTVRILKDLSSSIWLWHREGANGDFQVRKVIEIPAVPADPERLPPLLKGFGAVPPLVTDINLSLDDRALYVSCWGTGEMRQYDVSDPFSPQLKSTIQLGGIVNQAPHPASGGRPLRPRRSRARAKSDRERRVRRRRCESRRSRARAHRPAPSPVSASDRRL